jgi:hypothetical protein
LSPNYKGDLDNTKTDYPNQTWAATYSTLAGLASDIAFTNVFNSLSRIFINTWTFTNGINNPWINDISDVQLLNEYNEMYNLAVYLLSNFSNKQFILQNWEGDWALLGAFDPTAIIDVYRCGRYAAFLNVRQKAIEDARATITSTSTIAHAVECNRILDDFSFRVHRSVLPQVKCDAISWSAYEAINSWGTGESDAEANIISLMTKGFYRVKQALQPDITKPFTKRFYIGEYGFPLNDPGYQSLSLNTGNLIQKVIDTANSLGFTDVVWWQIVDNDELSPGNPRGYDLYIKSGSSNVVGALSDAGVKYQSIL